MMPSLMIDHLSINLRSGTDNLVSEISFAIKEGESLILLGQSGSGKTMTCSAVLNLLDPKKFKVSGSVFFGETDLLNSSEKQRRGIYGNQIVYIPQNPMTALDPSMRIGRQMDETLRLHSDKSRQQRYNYILRLLHDVGLDDPDRVYRAYPHMLSGGMLQRVIIAMAMMLDAKFVLADEPTTALDVIHRNGIIDLFSQMKANGVGILMVTHDFATALQLGGNMLVMKEGKIIESGEVQSVFDHTTEPYTRSLPFLCFHERGGIMIKVNNLSKEFHEQGTSNELLAVDHVDFTIQNGSFCALVGESGSGKSTLAQLMCGLLVPSSGEVLFEGKNISLCRGKQKQVLRSKIQLILQDGKGAMDPRFTVYQIIAEPIRNFRKLSKKEEEREINDLLTMMELPEEIKLRKAHELSGGQQKRVCIARALAAQPDVLIFDEAVSGLDVLVRKHILDLLKRLHQERKMTCFFITHDLDVALYLADRVMVMRCGKIIEDRTFHGSTDCFTHPYTKMLLHSIAPYLG